MTDKFIGNADSVFAPARQLVAITPNDATEIAVTPKALYIGGAGNISIIAEDDTNPVTLAVLAGAILPIRAKIVRLTGTTATGIVGLL